MNEPERLPLLLHLQLFDLHSAAGGIHGLSQLDTIRWRDSTMWPKTLLIGRAEYYLGGMIFSSGSNDSGHFMAALVKDDVTAEYDGLHHPAFKIYDRSTSFSAL